MSQFWQKIQHYKKAKVSKFCVSFSNKTHLIYQFSYQNRWMMSKVQIVRHLEIQKDCKKDLPCPNLTKSRRVKRFIVFLNIWRKAWDGLTSFTAYFVETVGLDNGLLLMTHTRVYSLDVFQVEPLFTNLMRNEPLAVGFSVIINYQLLIAFNDFAPSTKAELLQQRFTIRSLI